MDHSSMNMGGMDMPSSGNHMMNMAFHTSITDNLFSEAWAPKTTGQYAGACIFLIVLAIIHRALTALKSIQDAEWHKQEKARVIVVAGKGESIERSSTENEGKPAGAVSNVENVKSEQKEEKKEGNPWLVPWRFSTEFPRAGLSTVVSGIGYLLMLAVMTFNVGYFLSVLAGTFIGELAFGRIHNHSAH